MFDRIKRPVQKVSLESRKDHLQTSIDLLERGGILSWLAVANTRLEYLFKSREEILTELRYEKQEIERELDYIG